MKCVACQDEPATEEGQLWTLTFPMLCARCYVFVKELRKRGDTYDVTSEEERKDFVEDRAELFNDDAPTQEDGEACPECGSTLAQEEVGPDAYRGYCPECEWGETDE